MASIYRSFAERAPANAHDVRDMRKTEAPAYATPTAKPHGAAHDWSLARRSKPVHYMLPATIKWYAGLPVDQRPERLARHYARITNMFALHWSNPTSCAAYFDELLTDRRGGRRGFSPTIQRELLKLREFYYSGRLVLEP